MGRLSDIPAITLFPDKLCALAGGIAHMVVRHPDPQPEGNAIWQKDGLISAMPRLARRVRLSTTLDQQPAAHHLALMCALQCEAKDLLTASPQQGAAV